MTAELVKTKPEYVVMEDLNIRGMMKNRHLSKSIQNQKLREFRRMMEYKSASANIPVIKSQNGQEHQKGKSRDNFE